MNARNGAVAHRPRPGQRLATRPSPQITLGRLVVSSNSSIINIIVIIVIIIKLLPGF